jgi:hypothetical protein
MLFKNETVLPDFWSGCYNQDWENFFGHLLRSGHDLFAGGRDNRQVKLSCCHKNKSLEMNYAAHARRSTIHF